MIFGNPGIIVVSFMIIYPHHQEVFLFPLLQVLAPSLSVGLLSPSSFSSSHDLIIALIQQKEKETCCNSCALRVLLVCQSLVHSLSLSPTFLLFNHSCSPLSIDRHQPFPPPAAPSSVLSTTGCWMTKSSSSSRHHDDDEDRK